MESAQTTSPEAASVVGRQLATLQEWCLGPDAQSRAARQLRKVGVPADHDHVDDLCQDVLARVYERIRRSPLDEVPGTSAVEAYATRALRNAAVDLIRRGSPGRLEMLTDPTAGGGHLDQVEDPGAADELDGWVELDHFCDLDRDLRWLMHGAMPQKRRLDAWTVGAALVVLTLAKDENLELVAGIPVPDPKSRAARLGAIWAGLGYAGRSDCFDQPETGAVRERRSQAVQRVRNLISDALSDASTKEQT